MALARGERRPRRRRRRGGRRPDGIIVHHEYDPSDVTPLDILAYGEPMVEFNQTGEGDGRAVPAGLRRRQLELRDRRGPPGRAGRLLQRPRRRRLRPHAARAVGRGGRRPRERADRRRRLHRDLLRHPRRRAATSSTSSAAARRRAGCAPADVPRERIAAAKVLHLSGISLAISASACDTGYAAIEAARAAGVKVSFDTNLRLKLWSIDRARAVMSDVMRLADICLPSYDDVRAITGIDDPDALVDHCLRAGREDGRAEARRARRDRRRRRPAAPHRAASPASRSMPPAPATPSAAPSSPG